MLQCDNFDLSLRNLIGEALGIWLKSELPPYFEGFNNDFLMKVTSINVPRFHGQQNLDFGLTK